MTEFNFHPKTRTVAAAQIKRGDVVIESAEHPARVTLIKYPAGKVSIYCRYVWQPHIEPQWLLGVFTPSAPIQRAVR